MVTVVVEELKEAPFAGVGFVKFIIGGVVVSTVKEMLSVLFMLPRESLA